MRWLRRMRQRHADLDERLKAATAERELSERRLRAIREEVVTPVSRAGTRNQFTDIIAASLGIQHRQGGTAR